jgi:hypothetical protein
VSNALAYFTLLSVTEKESWNLVIGSVEVVGEAMKEIPAGFESRYRLELKLDPFPTDPEWLFELGMWPHWLWLEVDLKLLKLSKLIK